MIRKDATWFEVKIRYDKTTDDGQQKATDELYVVDALTFTEAEAIITEEMSSYISGDFEVKDIKKATYKEILFSDKATDDKWYKVKIQAISINEKTEKETRVNRYSLVQAQTLMLAVKYVEDDMRGSLADETIVSIAETKVMDVFEHREIQKKEDLEG